MPGLGQPPRHLVGADDDLVGVDDQCAEEPFHGVGRRAVHGDRIVLEVVNRQAGLA